MSLTYRGIPYTANSEVAPAKSVKLIYRGQVFERILQDIPLPSQDSSQNTVTLIYRGQVYNCKPFDYQPNIQSCHVNWRFRLG